MVHVEYSFCGGWNNGILIGLGWVCLRHYYIRGAMKGTSVRSGTIYCAEYKRRNEVREDKRAQAE